MLIISILALVAGPLTYHWLRRGGFIARTVDRVIVLALIGVLAFVLVPEVLDELGVLSLGLIAVGYLVPGLLEAAVRSAARTFHYISLFIALAGLVAHAALDGAGLASSASQPAGTLALAIVLHRFGVGLVLWLIVWPAFGRPAAMGVLGLVAVATVAGYFASGALLAMEQDVAVTVIESLIIGTIVHSLIHRGHAHPHPTAAGG